MVSPDQQQAAADYGSEFICEALVNWLPGVEAESIRVAAGGPWENGYIESFHSRLRDEFLERVKFEDVKDAQAKGSWYRREYNTIRPHSSLNYYLGNKEPHVGQAFQPDFPDTSGWKA